MLVSARPLKVSHNAVVLNPILQNLRPSGGFLPYQVDTRMHVLYQSAGTALNGDSHRGSAA